MLVALGGMVGAGLPPATAATTAGAERASRHCQALMLPVTVMTQTQTQPSTQNVAAWLCVPRGGATTIFVTQPGTTYDHTYWDFPYEPDRYSFVRAINAAGYAVLNVDRLGTGASDHPPAADVTLDTHVAVLHQIVGQLREGKIGGRPFRRVVTVGHSQGSGISTTEARQFGDVDGVVVTGWIHSNGSKTVAVPSSAFFWPAQADPKFLGTAVPAGYLTSRPDSRGAAFYYTPNADLNVISTDESTKTVSAGPEGPTAVAFGQQAPEPVYVPVLSVLGDRDAFFCTATCSGDSQEDPRPTEASSWNSKTCLEMRLQADDGHDINLHRNAQEWFALAIDWTHRRIGGPNNSPPSQPCIG
jgi:pimeloyl-ACP methyl ester carboxylesterase